MFTSKSGFKRDFKRKLSTMFGKALAESSVEDCYAALASLVRDELTERWVATNNTYLVKESRQVYYFSLEFLLGQFLESHLLYLGVRDVCVDALAEMGINMDNLLAVEPDAGLGNGGLGRLAACFLDSIAALALPGHGCGIRYKYGLFMQKIVDGYQVELPDNWLRETNVWEIRKPDKAVEVQFGGQVKAHAEPDGRITFRLENYAPVRAVPYDIPILGYRNNTVNTLRLWSAESAGNPIDFQSFSRGEYVGAVAHRYSAEAISEVLYPDDSNYQNRVLRLKQQYFFVSAGLQSIIRRFKKKANRDLRLLPDKICVQINDTHPALAVPELMRILMDDEGFGWDEAWSITTRIIAYTNHTIMPEALERWPVDTMRELLPRIYMIIEEINRRFCADLASVYPGDRDRWSRMAIVGDGVVRMAHLAVVGSFSVNGVAAVHTELLQTTLFKDFCEYYPLKFNNKTNGITHRRWLIKANPDLTSFLCDTISTPWISDPLQLRHLEKFKDDAAALDSLARIKRKNKERLADHILESWGIMVDPDAIFDVQIKRIHAYKRQLLNLLHIMHLLERVRAGEDIGPPRLFLMGGKAAPSYYYAKNVIKLANELHKLIASEPRCKGRLSLVFLENYGISQAELVLPATEVSEQISTASKEASGTSNMKFMMNGAVTIGTDDGANIEIRQSVGDDNFILFGMSVQQVLDAYAGGSYSPMELIRSDPRLTSIVSMMQSGFPKLPHDEFSNILRSLIDYTDEFFVLGDFDSYVAAQQRISRLYADRAAWNRMSLMNIAMSGVFSSDNTIGQYARDIWRLNSER